MDCILPACQSAQCRRTLLRVRWQEKVPDTEVLQRSEMEGIHAILMRSQLRWAGHVHRMDDSRLPKRVHYSELSIGMRTVSWPNLRFQDTLKASLKHCDIPQSTWKETADDRPAWRSIVKNGVADFRGETHQTQGAEAAERKRQ